MADSVRLDKFVWAIRLYKTRSEATEACNGNKVQLNGNSAKAHKMVKIGDVISVRKGPALLSYKVLQLAEQRMGAQLVPNFAENLTPGSELDKLHAPHESFFIRRDRGAGRPTKKDRREMDALRGELDANLFSPHSPAGVTVRDGDDWGGDGDDGDWDGDGRDWEGDERDWDWYEDDGDGEGRDRDEDDGDGEGRDRDEDRGDREIRLPDFSFDEQD